MRKHPGTGQWTPDPGGLLLQRKQAQSQKKSSGIMAFCGFIWNIALVLLVIAIVVNIL